MMRSLPSLLVSALFATSLTVACGGATTDASGTSSGGSSGGGSSSGGSSGGGDGGSSCTKAPVAGRRACVPTTAAAGTPLTLDIDASDGCLGCFTTLACNVQVSGTTITLAMESTTCPPAGDVACPAVCLVPQTKCTIPALTAGTYEVKVSGEGQRTGFGPRKLVVGPADQKGQTSCELPPPGTPPEPLDLSSLSTSCSTDQDCMLANDGNVCQVCKCPSTAIATSAREPYEALLRARTSQCDSPPDGIACAACAPVKAICKTDGTSLTGVCTKVQDNL